MDSTEVTELVSRLRHAFPAPRWTNARFAIYAENLEDLPFDLARAVVDELVRTRTDSFVPAIGEVRRRVQARIAHRQMLEQARGDRLLLTAPRDPKVREVLRDCIERLSRRLPDVPHEAVEKRELASPVIDDEATIRRRTKTKRRLREQAQALRERL